MKAISLAFVLGFISVSGFGQCENTFELKSFQKAGSEKKDGSIKVQVNARGRYVCELLAYKNIDKISIAKKEGSGNGEVIFEDLANDFFYRIVITFSTETDPLCQQRVIERVVLTSDKR